MSDQNGKKSRFSLKVEQKYAIIEYRDANPKLKQKDLIEHFNKLFKVRIPPTTMSGILSAPARQKVLKQDNVEALNKRIRECKYPEMEKMLHIWYTYAISKGVSISDEILTDKAKEFGAMLGIDDGVHFNYSDGWLAKFKIRFNLKQYLIQGESGSVSPELILKARKLAREFIKSWLSKGNGRSIKDIFNLDETALFYKLLPNRTLSDGPVSGKKVSKERITIAFIASANGEKIRPIVIGKHQKPRCFGKWNPNSVVDYYFNSTAWMTMEIWEKWLLNFNQSRINHGREALLIVDNAGGHNLSSELKKKLTHVTVEFLEPNTTSAIQPCDQGIIRNAKVYYRKGLVKHCVKTIEENDEIIMPDLKQAIFLLKDAWSHVSKETIVNCWTSSQTFTSP
jgi:hypothetical protein